MQLRNPILSSLILCAVTVSAQRSETVWESDTLNETDNPITTSVLVGSSIASGFNGGSAFTTYAAPSVQYRLDSRWTLGIGTMISNTSLNNWTNYSFSDNPSGVNNFTQQSVFLSASYRATDDITLNGAVYHSIWTLNNAYSEGNPLRMSGNTYILGMEYRLSENFRIGVEVSRTDGYQPFRTFNRNSTFFNSYPGSFGGFGWR